MSLSTALHTAAGGLATTQTMSRVNAENVANAMTPGYTRREVMLVSAGYGTGAAVIGEVRREVDTALVRMSRMEGSRMAQHQAIHEGLRDYTMYLGQPGEGLSPAEKFSEFNTSLTTLVNMPSSSGAQAGVIYAAEELAQSIRGASDTLASVRAEVDMEIRYEVADLNQALYDLARLNQQVREFTPGGIETAHFQDEIAGLLDQVAGIIDIRTTTTADGWVNVYTTGGAALLEGDRVQDVTYNPGSAIFMAGDQEITPNKDGIRGFEHGSLAGFAELKTDIIPRFQLQLDEYARGLIQAFEGADTSLGATDPGLFTDNGARFDASNLEGLASRLRINELVNDGPSGEVWRIRDGIGATTPGDASDTTQIQAFIDSLSQQIGVDPNTGISDTVTLRDFAGEMVTAQSLERVKAENDFNAASSAAQVVQAARENVEGVNIDDEMQKLMLIEQSFAANSKMLTAVGEMLDTLLAAV